jgi:hypothetical protein
MRAFLTILPKFQFAEEAFDWENDSIGFYNKYASLFGFIGLMYLPMVFGLKHYMHTREPLDLKGVLIVWNLLLAVLSAYGAYFTVPQGWKFIQDNGFVEGICDTKCYVHPYAVIILLFNLSKMAEFVDTILLRFRKKPVIFLHWYHHILTMFYCWYGNVVGSLFNCTGWYFAAIEFVSALDYVLLLCPGSNGIWSGNGKIWTKQNNYYHSDNADVWWHWYNIHEHALRSDRQPWLGPGYSNVRELFVFICKIILRQICRTEAQ